MTIKVACKCGQRFRARDGLAGKTVRCPKCKAPLSIPAIDLGYVPEGMPQDEDPPPWDNMLQLLTVVAMAWALLTIVVLAACAIFKVPVWGMFVVLLLLCGVGGFVVANLYLAKSRAVTNHSKNVKVLGGLAQMVLWEPVEGIVFLKNKQIQAVDANAFDGGGIRYIYPLLGEQVGLRVPLTIQSTEFCDSDVYTKDYIPVTIRISIWWKISAPERYFLSISQEVGALTDKVSADRESTSDAAKLPDWQLRTAERWLAMTAESVSRQELGQSSTALLVASQISSSLPPTVRNQTPGASSHEEDRSYKTTTDALSQRLAQGVGAQVRDYGLEIERVEVQEISLPKEIHAAAVEACQVAFLPAKAEREARARELQLRADVNVLGKDAVALREVLGSAEGMSFLGVPDFLEKLFGQIGQNRRLDENGG